MNSHPSATGCPPRPRRKPRRGAWSLAAAVTLIVMVWLVVLPRHGRDPEMAAYLESLRRNGIDGGASFYTELPMMQPLLRRLERDVSGQSPSATKPPFERQRGGEQDEQQPSAPRPVPQP